MLQDSQQATAKKSKARNGTQAKRQKTKSAPTQDADDKQDTIRVEHLNYKRLTPGMRVLAQVTHVLPLALVLSLPNQLLGHVPITRISKELTARLESMGQNDSDADDSDEDSGAPGVPDLSDIFRPGQYVTAIVSVVHASGTTVDSMLKRGGIDRSSQRVELSLVPEEVNEPVVKRDLGTGMVCLGAF